MQNLSVEFIANSKTTSFLKWFIGNVHEGLSDDLRDGITANFANYQRTLNAIKQVLTRRNQLTSVNEYEIDNMLNRMK